MVSGLHAVAFGAIYQVKKDNLAAFVAKHGKDANLLQAAVYTQAQDPAFADLRTRPTGVLNAEGDVFYITDKDGGHLSTYHRTLNAKSGNTPISVLTNLLRTTKATLITLA